MAADTPAPAAEAPALTTEAVVTPTEVEKPVKETDPRPEKEGQPEAEAPEKKDDASAIGQSTSFKEESNRVEDLIDPEKKALDELKLLVSAALAKHEFTKPPPPPPTKEEDKPEQPKQEDVKPSEEPKKLKDCLEAEKTPDETTSAEVEVPVPEPETVAVAVVVVEETKAVVVEDDGAKTVEAIEETVVSVAAEPPPTVEAKVEAEKEEETTEKEEEDVFLWGVPLLGGGEKSDTILLKFLRARDFKVKDALAMIKSTVIWRKEFGVDHLLEEDLGLKELEKAVYMHGVDKEGHPVCYNVFGEFQEKDLYQLAFGDEDKRKRFLRWRLQLLEKEIRGRLDFSPDGINTMVHVIDLKNSPQLYKKEVRHAYRHALHLLQDNYPEFVAKQVHINVPWWYLAFNRMMSPFMTQRTKSKCVFAGPSKSAETLFKYIAPEQVPVQYGGIDKENDPDFCTSDAVSEITLKPSSKQTIEIPVSETCLLVWELRVLGWDVSYGAEFTPAAEGGYTVIVQKARKFSSTDEPIEKNNFKIGEPGKIALTIDNATSKKKKLLYRFKIKKSTEST